MAATPATLLTRRQVAALLGVTEAEIKARDGEAFHPVKGPDGSWRYPPEEVTAAVRGGGHGDAAFEPAGAVCAAAFELFQAGKKLPEVVIALKQTPALVRQLRAEYDAMAASLTISPEAVTSLEKAFRTSVRSEARLLELFASMDQRMRSEFDRGHKIGLVEGADMGEIVDPETGAKRPLNLADAAERARVAEERWIRLDDATKGTSTGNQSGPP